MNTKVIAGVAAGVIAVIVLAYVASVQQQQQEGAEVEEVFGAGLQNARTCVDGDFEADPDQDVVEIAMDAYQWRFSYCSIKVYQGQTVMIIMKSLDIPHGFAIDGYPEVANVHLSPNAETIVRFTADKVGIFTYFCTVFCGEGHPMHDGDLIVQSS